MKRQSTTQKLSTVTLRNLITFCKSFRCGIILRIAGVEVGYTVDELEGMLQQIKIYGFARYFNACECPVPTLVKDWWQAWGGVFGVHAYSELSDCEFRALVVSEIRKDRKQSINPIATPSQLLDWVSIEVVRTWF